MKSWLVLLCLGVLNLPGFVLASTPINRVIYITLDGVRWQDIYNTKEFFPILWEKYASEGTFYGAPNSNTVIEVASIPVSLPSYQSQTSGAVQDCIGNDCGRIKAETFLEALVLQKQFSKKDVATFSSWYQINLSVEQTIDTTYTNTGNFPAYDPNTGLADHIMHQLNLQQEVDHPDEIGARHDKYTFAQALHYLETFQPRFLWISMNDADEIAHENRLLDYQQTLRFYDQSLDVLFTKLKALHLDQKTLVIVTTDHGRGDGENWTDHGIEHPSSKQTWAFVMNGELKPDFVKDHISHYSTLSIRPTVEAIFTQ